MNIPAPFSQRQYDYVERSQTARYNIAEGGFMLSEAEVRAVATLAELFHIMGRLADGIPRDFR